MVTARNSFELSEIQRGIYFECQVADPIAYNISGAIRLEGLDEKHFENACKLVVAEQALLRVSIDISDDLPVFIIHDHIDLPLIKQSLTSEGNQECIDAVIKTEVSTPFDFKIAPLFRLRLLRLITGQHIFIICIHHLIADGMSLGIFSQKLFAYYDRLVNKKMVTLIKDNHFKNFVEKENAKLRQHKLSRQKEYWLNKMEGVEPLHLFTDYALLKVISGCGQMKCFTIENQLAKAIEQLAADQEVTVFLFYLSTFSVLMSHCVQLEDVTIASPFVYRPDWEIEETIGCFVHMLPLRFDLNKDLSFSQILKASLKTFIGAYKNVDYPNNLIVRDQLSRGSKKFAAIFNISFVYDSYDTIDNDLQLEYIDSKHVTFAENLMAILCKKEEQYFLKIQYKTDCYSEASIDLLGRRYLSFLKQVTSNVNICLRELDLFLEGEKSRVLHEFNYSHYFPCPTLAISDFFDFKVGTMSDHAAVISADCIETYASLNTKADCLADLILSYKKRINDRVAIQLDRSIDWVIAALAVLKSGCAYVAIDPSYPLARKQYILDDADVSLLITSSHFALSEVDKRPTIFLDKQNIQSSNIKNNVKNTPNDLAYIAYTSGSSGTPKGVMVENRSVMNTLFDLERRFPMKKGDKFLWKTAVTFDISVTELFGWFFGEGSVIILPVGDERNPQRILDIIASQGITHINFVPSMFRHFLELFNDKNQVQKLQSLKWIFIGGEKLTLDIVEKFQALNTSIQLQNMYGPTECTLWSTHAPIESFNHDYSVPIGRPLNEYRCYVVSLSGQLQPVGLPGELCISGAGVACGYVNLEQATKKVFIDNPFFDQDNDAPHYAKMYRTGDLVRWGYDGNLHFLGRIDAQVKIRGMRMELEEVETVLKRYPGVIDAIAMVKHEPQADHLCVYYQSSDPIATSRLKEFLSLYLPNYMLPVFYIHKENLPLSNNGKINRSALLEDLDYKKTLPNKKTGFNSTLEHDIAEVWQDVLNLNLSSIHAEDNFFDLGGHSLLLIQVHHKLVKKLQVDFSLNILFQLPTIRDLTSYFSNRVSEADIPPVPTEDKRKAFDIAIIGMSINAPGANNIADFWDNLVAAKESLYFYQEDELIKLGVPLSVVHSPEYVKVKGKITGIEQFDHHFFQYTPTEVEAMSPQLRLLYPGLWEAFEDAGYYPGQQHLQIGLFLGASDDFEWYKKFLSTPGSYNEKFQAGTLSTNHFLATRLAYKLDIRGPVISSLTACSTTLVNVHLACQSLLSKECQLAIAGGITVELPIDGGYFYEDGLMFSKDGHCRPFDEQANGTVFSNGMGFVVLKRLAEAVRDGDHIYAVIKGSAINNDGNQKLGFAAPSPAGQVDVIRSAYEVAVVDPVDVSYVEAHGTGTTLGDPIEVAALSEAFASNKKQYCTLGSVKGNIGHTDTAAGVIGLIKVALSMKNEYIPATVNYQKPNPKIDFTATPFLVKSSGHYWSNTDSNRYAGINSFGIGGTNVHMVLASAPRPDPSSPPESYHLLLFSAKTSKALFLTAHKVANFLTNNPTINVSDVAWTLQVGRKPFIYRKFLVLSQKSWLDFPTEVLEKIDEAHEHQVLVTERAIYFLCSGEANPVFSIGRDLYFSDNNIGLIYQHHFNEVLSLFSKEEKANLLNTLYFSHQAEPPALSPLAIFSMNYALSKLCIQLGIQPKKVIGYGVGDITARVIMGTLELKHALVEIQSFSVSSSKDQHLLFESLLAPLLQDENGIFIELGPSNALTTLAKQHSLCSSTQLFMQFMSNKRKEKNDIEYILRKIGQLWAQGININWHSLKGDHTLRYRLSLPTYAFDLESYPIILKSDLPWTNTNHISQQQESSLSYEEKIIKAYQEVLGFDQIEPDQDFFSLGGDSLLVVSLSAKMQEKWSIKIDSKYLFQFTTPRSLSTYLSGNHREMAVSNEPVITPTKIETFYPLSSAQARMYTVYLLDKTSTAYHLSSTIFINGKLDLDRFEKAARKLVNRHESLRTIFSVKEGMPVQIVQSHGNVEIQYIETIDTVLPNIEAFIAEHIQPFDLHQGPLFRSKLFKLADEKHLFLFDIHHIIADASSMEIISRDFSQLYSNEMPTLPIQYRDFAVWQKSQLNLETLQQQKLYWLNELADPRPYLTLPTDFKRPSIKNYAGYRIYFKLPEDLSQQLIQFSQKKGVTLFVTLLSIWCLVIARYAGQEDVVIGVPVSGRHRKELEDIVGMFVNVLALRMLPENKKSFLNFLQAVKNKVFSSFQHQDYQFDELIQQLHVERTLNRHPLFDIAFDFQNIQKYDLIVDDLTFSPYELISQVSIYDLLLTCSEDRDKKSIECFMEYSTELFKRSTIERLIENFKTCVRNVLRNDSATLGDIEIVSDTERQLLMKNFNDTYLFVNSSDTIQSLFSKCVLKFGDRVALVTTAEKSLSYSMLNQLSDAFAEHLFNLGVAQYTKIGILLSRNEFLFISLLGVLKLGAAYVPIDPAFPSDRIRFMISNCDVLISDQSKREDILFSGLCIDPRAIPYQTLHGLKIQPSYTGDDLACVIFTSGSTGQPKGVMLKHSSLVNFVKDINNRKIFSTHLDRMLSVTTVSFDLFFFEAFVPLCLGYSVYLADETEQLDPVAIGKKITQHKITHFSSTVSRIKSFIENPYFLEALKQLSVVISVGEHLPLTLLNELQTLSTAKIYNAYGPTEVTIWSTIQDVTQAKQIDIGQPIANTQIYIVNANRVLQPIGVFGELCLSGAGLSLGFLQKCQEQNQFTVLESINQVLCYRTGDQARFLENGSLDLCGRLDSQVKIRGHRVELDELEKVAELHEHIKRAAAIVFPDKNNDNQIALYYQTKASVDGACHNDCLRESLRKKLAYYLLPSYYKRLENFPLLPNGKINRKLLTPPSFHNSPSNEALISQNTNIETLLLSLWKTVLSVDHVTTTDNFFDLGGNSLGLIQLSNKLSEILKKPIPLMQFFEYPTIRSFANALNLDQFSCKPSTIDDPTITSTDIAVIGMAGKFPGAENIDEFWQNIAAGKENISHFTEEELLAHGIDQTLLSNRHYVRAKGILAGTEYFDSAFFGYSEKDANVMDPQLRLLHECTWTTLENAGYNPDTYSGKIGLFAGSSTNILWVQNLLRRHTEDPLESFEALTFNEKDFLTTRLAYKLNLRGPSYTIQTACSTSLVAIHQAVQSLINQECDMAIAGGVSISHPLKEGYLWHDGMIFSKDGHCKPFSAEASGIVAGNGVGLVMLKPLDKAIRDHDHIYAVIKGSAINNDGLEKVGYTAPSVSGQRSVIESALKKARIEPETIAYLEAHGTGTALGDPIEIKALKSAWRTDKKQFCAIGSVKANIGHLDAAAGVAGFIKTVLLLYHRMIPPLLHFKKTNPLISFEDSPFYVADKATSFSTEKLLRASVSSFGIGGTNAHIILEQSNIDRSDSEELPINLLIFSARSIETLKNNVAVMMSYLNNHIDLNFSDVAWTLQSCRKFFEFRQAFIISRHQLDDAMEPLTQTKNIFIKEIQDESYVMKINDNQIESFFDNYDHTLSNIKKIAALWYQGYEIDWSRFYFTQRNRVPLPSYQFEKKYHPSDIDLKDNISSKRIADTKQLSTEEIKHNPLMNIWRNIFDCDIQWNDDFFRLGGDSLKAAILCTKIQEAYHIEIQPSQVFQYSIFSDMHHLILSSKKKDVLKLKIPKVSKKPYYETSISQKRIYTSDKILNDSLAYNFASAFFINGQVDFKKFERVFNLLLERHEAFRTRFSIINGNLVQIVEDKVSSFVEFGDIDELNIQSEINDYMRPFDLSKAPLIRVKLLKIYNKKLQYLLLLDMHHIISDHASVKYLIQEFTDLYANKVLPPLDIQYKDFSEWQNHFLQSTSIESQMDFWQNEMKAPIPVLNLKTDYPRLADTENTAEAISFLYDYEISKRISELTTKHALTPYMVFLSTFTLLLWKYTSQKDFVIGTAVSGRHHTDLKSVIGIFANTLALRIQVDDSLSLSEYLQKIKEKVLQAFDHQDFQFEKLLELLELNKSESKNHLFDVVFNYLDMDGTSVAVNDFVLTPIDSKQKHCKFDMTLTISKIEGQYSFELEYNSSLFSSESIELFTKYYNNLLSAILENKSTKLNTISLISFVDRDYLLYDLNQTKSVYPSDKNIIELFQEIALSYSHKVALYWRETTISYQTLQQKIDALSVLLLQNKVSVGQRVSILLNRGPLQIIAIFAVLKVGAIYVPIEINYPTERIQWIVKDSDSCLLLTETQFSFTMTNIKILYLQIDNLVVSANIVAMLKSIRQVTAIDPAYIMYTSGSTGKPKGTLITHRNVVRLVKNNALIQIVDTDLLLQWSNYAFDGSVFDIFGALLNGASLFLIDKQDVIEIERLIDIIREHKVTVFYINSSLFNHLVERGLSGLECVRKILIGGEALSVTHISRALSYLGPEKLINGYGPTETTVFSLYYPINILPNNLSSVPVGYPLSNTTVYILDQYKEPVPINIVGELYIGGDGVGGGYLNNPELTQQKFLKSPFLPNEIIYRTGDLVRRLPSGVIEFIGREDDQVKVRGYRIELSEIESQLREIPAVSHAVVLSAKDSLGDPYIAAYYTLAKEVDSKIDQVDEIRKYLQMKIPSYMVPEKIHQVSSLPLNANGKIDRAALLHINNTTHSLSAFTPPRNTIETLILEQMKQVLDNNNIGIHDDFFNCGGNSIKAIALVHALSKINIVYKVNTVFNYPTVAKLAVLLDPIHTQQKKLNDSAVGLLLADEDTKKQIVKIIKKSNQMISHLITSSDIISSFPLASIQRQHFLSGSNPSGFCDTIEASIGESELSRVIVSIVKNQQLLHCSIDTEQFLWHEHEITFIDTLIEKNIPFLDLRQYENQEAIINQVTQFVLFDPYIPEHLSWRLCCLRLSDCRYFIIWGVDHVAFDGMSAEILRDQLAKNIKIKNSMMSNQIYSKYVQFLEEGPVNISEKRIISLFLLIQWKRRNDVFLDQAKAFCPTELLECCISIAFDQLGDFNPFATCFDIVKLVLVKYFSNEAVPISVVHYGRQYNGLNFYQCIGEFLDLIPFLLTPDSSIDDLTKAITYCQDYRINFMSLLYNPTLMKQYQELVALLSSYWTKKPVDTILFNFQGYINNSENHLFESRNSLKSSHQLARFYVSAHYNDTHLHLTFESIDGFDKKLMQEIVGSICSYADLSFQLKRI